MSQSVSPPPSVLQPRPGWDAVHATATARLPGLLRLLGVAPCDLDDVFQDVVFAAYRAFERFDPTRRGPSRPPAPSTPAGEAPVLAPSAGVEEPPAGEPGAPAADAPPRGPSGTRTAVSAWLCGIAWRQVRHYLERAYRRREVPMGLADAPCFERFDPARSAELHLAAEERRALAIHLLSSVSPERRILLVLKDTYEVPVAEIAQALELNVNTVYTRLRLARADFRAAVKRLRPEERQALASNLFLFPFVPRVLLRAVREPAGGGSEGSGHDPAPAALEDGTADRPGRRHGGSGALRGGIVGSLAGGAAVAAVLLALAPPPMALARRFDLVFLRSGALYGALPGTTGPEPGAAAPAPAAAATTAALQTGPDAPAPRPAKAGYAPIDEEYRWLDAAHEALLHDDPATALEQLAEHTRRFPRGRLRSTREQLRVWAKDAVARAAVARAAGGASDGGAPDGGR